MGLLRAKVGGSFEDTAHTGSARVSGLWVPFGPSGTPTIRNNACPNPAAKNNITGWSTNSATPVVRSTGVSGFLRTTAVHHLGNGFIQSPWGTALPGETWTLSVYIKNVSGFDTSGKDMYFMSRRSSGGDHFQQLADTPAILNGGAVVRATITGTTPANTTGVGLLIDTLNGTFDDGWYLSCALFEKVGTTGDYFDGDSPNAVWDGTNGNSSSTETT